MKNAQNLAMLSAVIAFASCQSKAPVATENSVDTTQTETSIPVESTATSEETPAETKTVEGIVREIQPGKDGYTAKIETADKMFYFVTISHANLKNHEQYKSVKVGETLKVTGDSWKAEEENHITVREIN